MFAYQDATPGEGVSYWAEGWNGFLPARQRPMDSRAAQRTQNRVIPSGDVHALQANDVHARPGNVELLVAATNFVTTSISSGNSNQTMVDSWPAKNPNMHNGFGDLRSSSYRTVTPDAAPASCADGSPIGRNTDNEYDQAAAAPREAFSELPSPRQIRLDDEQPQN